MENRELEYVGFWVRVVASLIDTVLMVLIITPLLAAVYGRGYVEMSIGTVPGTPDLLLSWVLPAVAVIAFWVARQATPGKMVFSARIVDARTGREPSAGQCIGRYLAYFVSSIPFCLGFLWVAIDRRKQGWHDKLAGTVVVRPARGGVAPVIFPEGDDFPEPGAVSRHPPRIEKTGGKQ
ncbi:MAG: RDD family protein [Gammaproteobacteria bacterium]|nr:RDD family protein [Gammaproteobacteria bacterium]